ncbi:MAG: hypothetical protein IKT56_03710, partial [Clostridia bacterium]|nr:hypothetical protein [Clostridia bacterium]
GSIGTGFIGTPTAVYNVDKSSSSITFNAKIPFDLEYFVIDKNTYSTETLANMFNYKRMPDDVTDITINTISKSSVHQGENKDIALVGVLKSDKYLAIRAKADSTTKYTPTIISIATIDDGVKGADTPSISFGSTSGMVQISIQASADAAGKTFEYYYTNTEPKTTANYNTIFKGNGPSGSVTITSSDTGSLKTFEAGKWLDMAEYKYLVFRVVSSTGESMTPGYVTLPTIYRANASITASQSIQGQLNVSPCDTEKYTVYWFYSKTQLTVTKANFSTSYNSNSYCRGFKNVEAASAGAEQYIQTDFSQPTGTNATQYKYIYVCLKDAAGKYYQPVELKVPGTYTVGG